MKIMKKVTKNLTDKWGEDIVFNMPRTMAEDLVDKNTPRSKVFTQEFLCEYVNDQMHFLGNCVKVNLV